MSAATTVPHVRGGRLALVVILGAMSAFGPISIDLYLPALPDLATDLNASTSGAQLTLTACLVGLGLGQLVAGSVSDQLGRRRPVLVSIGLYAVASLLCVVAPSLATLVVMRFVQGLTGGAATVIARAIVRDMFSGIEAAKMYSILTMIWGVSPILAPVVGGLLLHVTDWRGVFLPLALFGIVLFVMTFVSLPETLPAARRRSGGLRDALSVGRELSRDREFVGLTITFSLALGALLAYVAASPFVLEDIHGVSPTVFSIIFGINALGMAGAGRLNHQLLGKIPTTTLLYRGLVAMAVGGVCIVLGTAVLDLGLVGTVVPLFVVSASAGLIIPNATALALAHHPDVAGTASALMGFFQCVVAATTASVVGLWGSDTAVPMAMVILLFAVGGLVSATAATRRNGAPVPAGSVD